MSNEFDREAWIRDAALRLFEASVKFGGEWVILDQTPERLAEVFAYQARRLLEECENEWRSSLETPK